MKQDYRELLKPELINSVSSLALIARVLVDGFLSGRHESRRVGQGMEFSQYRAYEPGDDMRLLDWKMLARSGRYYIKQSDIDTHVTVKFIVDASASMQYKEEDLSKMEYVRVLVASLAYLAHQQGDAVGLFSLNDKKLNSIYPASNKQHYNRLLNQLIHTVGAASWPKNRNDINRVHNRNHKELLFFITDMHEYDEELSKWIKQLKTSKNEVAVLHILGKKELDFDYSGALVFEDLETNERIKVDAKTAKDDYVTAMESRLSSIKNLFTTSDIGYDLFTFDSPMQEALKLFLKKRIRLG